MKKPDLKNIKDKNVLEYIQFLENGNVSTLVGTKNKFNRGIQRQIDFLSDELLRDDFKLSLTSDTEVDRFLKILKESTAICSAMEKFELQAFPKNEDNSKKIVKEDGVEQFIKSTTIATTT